MRHKQDKSRYTINEQVLRTCSHRRAAAGCAGLCSVCPVCGNTYASGGIHRDFGHVDVLQYLFNNKEKINTWTYTLNNDNKKQ